MSISIFVLQITCHPLFSICARHILKIWCQWNYIKQGQRFRGKRQQSNYKTSLSKLVLRSTVVLKKSTEPDVTYLNNPN